MDDCHKFRLLEEAKQRNLGDVLAKAQSEGAQTMKDEIMEIGLIEAGTVKGLINQIWDRAIEEPASCSVLAEMCALMPANFDPPEGTAIVEPSSGPRSNPGSRNNSEKRVDFRLMMIKKCKEELEKGTAAIKDLKKWEAKAEATGPKEKLKGDEKAAFDADKAARTRMLSAMTFIAHLYLANVATEKIMHSAIEVLLKNEKEPLHEDVEKLCQLCRIVGSKLDGGTTSRSSKDGKTVDGYFAKIQKMKDIAVTKDTVKRLDEVLCLRGKGWAA